MLTLTNRQLNIMGFLMSNPSHGYKIRKELLTIDTKLSFGTLYPALKRLEKLGLVSSKWENELTENEKKIFSLTGKGEIVLSDHVLNMNQIYNLQCI